MNTNPWELAPLEASWLPVELGHSSALLSADLGNGEWERPTTSRKETATRLLELLDHGQINFAGSESGWLDEKAELPLFGEIDSGTFVSPLELEDPAIFSAPDSPMFAPSSPVFISGPSSPIKDIKIEEDCTPAPAENDELFNINDIISQLEQQENCDDYLEIEAAKVADSIMGLIPAVSLDHSGSGAIPIDLTALLQSAIEDNTGDDFSTSSEDNTMVDAFDCSLGFKEDCNQTMTSIPTPGRRRSARAKAQPYQVPDKLQPAPSGAGIPVEPSNSPAGPSGRGRRAKLPVEDRKLRKKEQNKTAATRYRMKKKAETEHLSIIEQSLEDRHNDLRKQHDDLAHEVAYLKKLMKEIGILA